MTHYEAVIGLEIHIQINSARKAFCSCSTAQSIEPNTNICPVCTGQPGALPVLNDGFLHRAILFASAIESKINLESTFDRKNYFYPDMPKNYQITQFFKPIGEAGVIRITGDDGTVRPIRVERVHMEEDTAKSIHLGDKTMLNFNRAGVPLIEVVSHPDLRSGREANEYFKKIYDLAVVYLGICQGNMEEGNLRCDANVSIRQKGSDQLNTKAEVKNVNSFAFIQKAIDYEIERQIELVTQGGMVEPETRLWNAKLKRTETMRKKTTRNDYRYFNEPDLGPLRIPESLVTEIKAKVPELPDAKRERLTKQYGISGEQLDLFIGYPAVCNYFEKAVAAYLEGAPRIASWLSSELLRLADKEKLEASLVTPEALAQLVRFVDTKRLTGPQAKEVLEIMYKDGRMPEMIIASDSRFGVIDSSEVDTIIAEVLAASPSEVEKYLGGKENLFGFFVGQVMKRAKGKASPEQVNETLKKELTKLKK